MYPFPQRAVYVKFMKIEMNIFNSDYDQDATHTTYIAKCDNGGANVCTLPAAGATIVTGSSYVGCSYTDPSEPL